MKRLLALALACTPSKPAPHTGQPAESAAPEDSAAPTPETADSAPEQVPGVDVDDEGCNVLYAQDRLPVFELTITEEEWLGLKADYASGVEQYHPTVFTYWSPAGEALTVTDAAVRLRGNPGFSWITEKMQFGVAFNESDPDGRFLGLRHLSLDAVWYEPSLLRDRVAYAWLRHIGVPAPCANNAELWVNGEYYGLYKNIEYPDREWVERVYGDDDATGVLWKYGSEATVNAEDADPATMTTFWSNTSVAWQEANTDLQANIEEWAAEAVLPQNDGYWCCNHNFYLYEHPTRGVLFVPWDLDFAFDDTPYFANPYTFYRDSTYQPHFDAVTADPVWGPRFVAAMRAAVDAYDPDLLAEWTETWSAQIADSVAREPHATHSPQAQADAAARLAEYVYNRRGWLEAWVRCEEGAEDGDSDGFGPCEECDDQDFTIFPGAPETCNGRDDDCDGLVDDAADCDTCDAYSFEDSRFLLCTTPRTWEEAQAVCVAEGGSLGFPMNTGDWYVYWIHTYWQELAWTGRYWWWVGATDGATEGSWLTPEGESAAPWASWISGAPGGGTTENCAAASPAYWGWDDRLCVEELPFVCRLP